MSQLRHPRASFTAANKAIETLLTPANTAFASAERHRRPEPEHRPFAAGDSVASSPAGCQGRCKGW